MLPPPPLALTWLNRLRAVATASLLSGVSAFSFSSHAASLSGLRYISTMCRMALAPHLVSVRVKLNSLRASRGSFMYLPGGDGGGGRVGGGWCRVWGRHWSFTNHRWARDGGGFGLSGVVKQYKTPRMAVQFP